jgi:choline dehydrogenase-like flavoprotein
MMANSNPLRGVHDALFDTFFPEDLPVPQQIRGIIRLKAVVVSDGMYARIQQSADLQRLLAPLVNPSLLPQPLIGYLKGLNKPAIDDFLKQPGGFGGIKPEFRAQILSAFFASSEPLPKSPLAKIAMNVRLFYLSAIWDLDLAVPLTGIQKPTVFVDDVEVYATLHAPRIPKSRLIYDANTKTIRHEEGDIDYLVIGSGPGGSTVAHQLATRQDAEGKRARVVLIERGPFVVWGSMDTRSYPTLMFKGNVASTESNSVIIRSGQTMGGGTTVNVDLAFSPLEGTIFSRIQRWADDGRIDKPFYTAKRIAAAYQWVRDAIQTRQLTQTELNRDNLALWNGAIGLGVDPSLYHLNRFAPDLSPSPVTDKRDAARQLILEAMQDPNHPLCVIPDALIQEILFDRTAAPEVTAKGVKLKTQRPWTDMKNTIVDPNSLAIPDETEVTIEAKNVILAAGSLGTTRVLLKTAKNAPELANDNIGKAPVLHPSMPIIGSFKDEINLLRGLDCASFVDSFGITPGFIFETITGMPDYGAVMTPGSAAQVYNVMSGFNRCAGFGVMLVDTPSPDNALRLDSTGEDILIDYELSDADKARFRIGIALAVRMMFMAKATSVVVPSNENFQQKPHFDPMDVAPLRHIDQADAIADNLKFTPNRSLLTSAHLQAANKIGNSPADSVVSWKQRVWNVKTGREIPNLYVMDGSIFPSSIGANPMQSIYTFAKIFSDRLLEGIDKAARPKAQLGTPERHYTATRVPIAFPH